MTKGKEFRYLLVVVIQFQFSTIKTVLWVTVWRKGTPAVYFAFLHVMDAPNTYKSKHGEEIIWNLKSYQGWKIQLCFRVTLVIRSAQHSLFVCSLLKDNSVILLLKDNSACFYPSQFITLCPSKGLLKDVSENGLSQLTWGFGWNHRWNVFNLSKHRTTAH